MPLYLNLVLYLLLTLCSFSVQSNDQLERSNIDFINYRAEITPVPNTQSIDGKVTITFLTLEQNIKQLNFSAQFKQIKSAHLGQQALDFSVSEDVLILNLPLELATNTPHSVTVTYTANPTRGMKFYDDHLFSVYHTKNWLVSHTGLSDKATFDLFIKHEPSLMAIGNGHLVSKYEVGNGQVVSHWQQTTPIPLYTFGFALGHFKQVVIASKDINISILYREQAKSGLTSYAIKQAFTDVTDMLSFFNEKAGFKQEQDYTYVVVEGYMAQEASNYSLVGEKFVHTLLNNKNENWFIAHELAHEWWGNSITSANFSHFWLNEGLVVFLVAAYKQHLFGDNAYKDEMKLAMKRVQRAVQENRVAPVAFSKIIKEQEINRTMAYSKGALVFYMLREQLGDKVFWQALKQYSQKYKGQSVTTTNLQATFEQSSGLDLTNFFQRWVYGQAIPTLKL